MKIKYKFEAFILLAAIFIGGVLRLYNLGQYPLTNDEAALGYNAYSILKTGRDEHGQFLPVIFKSFGDWKPGLYVYLAAPFIYFVGLNEITVRLPSAILGIASIVLIYLLGNELFNRKVALFASLAIAVSPWHIQFSRGAWEANAALALLLVAIILFLKSFKNSWLFLLSAIFFALTLWTYQSAKLASALVLILLLIIYKNKLRLVKPRVVITSGVLGILISLPIILSVFSDKGGRIEVMSVFSYQRPQEYVEETILNQGDISRNSLSFKLFHSENFNLARGVFGRYFNYFSGRFLFFEGDWSSPRHTSPGSGYVLLIEIPLLLLGVSVLARRKNRAYWFIILWLLLAPISGAITQDSVHGIRALNMVIPLSFAIALGMFRIKNRILRLLIFGGYFYSVFLFIDSYFVQKNYENTYLYGYKEVVNEVLPLRDKYDKIIFDQSFDQPYIFFLFYGLKTDDIFEPENYQKQSFYVEKAKGDVGLVEQLGNIEFRPINWPADKTLENTILVGRESAFPLEEVDKVEDYNVSSIYYPSGERAFLVVQKNEMD